MALETKASYSLGLISASIPAAFQFLTAIWTASIHSAPYPGVVSAGNLMPPEEPASVSSWRAPAGSGS